MKTVNEHIRDHLLLCMPPSRINVPSYEACLKSEWNLEFESLMRQDLGNRSKERRFSFFIKYMKNRLITGCLRYGPMSKELHTEKTWKHAESAYRRMQAFVDNDRRLEHTIDCANLCILQYMWGKAHGQEFNSDIVRGDVHYHLFQYNELNKNIYHLVRAAVEAYKQYSVGRSMGLRLDAVDDGPIHSEKA